MCCTQTLTVFFDLTGHHTVNSNLRVGSPEYNLMILTHASMMNSTAKALL